jgi:hypothetical protein
MFLFLAQLFLRCPCALNVMYACAALLLGTARRRKGNFPTRTKLRAVSSTHDSKSSLIQTSFTRPRVRSVRIDVRVCVCSQLRAYLYDWLDLSMKKLWAAIEPDIKDTFKEECAACWRQFLKSYDLTDPDVSRVVAHNHFRPS